MSKPNWSLIKIKLGDILAWEENPRFSTVAQAKRIIESEKKFNQVIPFIVSPFNENRKVLLYDGHQRLAAWITVYGLDHVMDAMQADRKLLEDEHRELIITLHAGATGAWDWNKISTWDAGQLQEWGLSTDTLQTWGQDYGNLKGFLESEQIPGPNLNPIFSTARVIDEDIIKEKSKLDNRFKEGDEYLEVICPHCASEFYINKKDVK